MLQSGGNVVMLDEPTNDLDVDTLRSLEDAMLGFGGCVLVTSHDRWFLDRIATHILAFEGNSRVVWFEGNYEDYDKDRRKRLGAEAVFDYRTEAVTGEYDLILDVIGTLPWPKASKPKSTRTQINAAKKAPARIKPKGPIENQVARK